MGRQRGDHARRTGSSCSTGRGPLGGLRKFGAPLLDMYLRVIGSGRARNADDPVPLEQPEEHRVGGAVGTRTSTDCLARWEQARLNRSTGYLGRFLDYDTPGYSPRDLQLVEITEAITKDVAQRLFGLLGYCYLGVDDGSSTTYANVVDRRRDLLEGTQPVVVRHDANPVDVRGPRYYLEAATRVTVDVGRQVHPGTGPEIRFGDDRF